jgi:nucleotide-binding universal stress UspA family protein
VIKTVLLAADLSAYTPSVLKHATELAQKHRAKLVIVHAVEPLGSLGHALLKAYLKPETSLEITTNGLDAMIREVKSQVVDFLTEEYMDGEADLENLGDVVVREGMPATVIQQVAEEVDADVIIVGSHSPDVDNPSSLGTVAQKVISGAKIPVYIVPNECLFWRQEGQNNQMRLW